MGASFLPVQVISECQCIIYCTTLEHTQFRQQTYTDIYVQLIWHWHKCLRHLLQYMRNIHKCKCYSSLLINMIQSEQLHRGYMGLPFNHTLRLRENTILLTPEVLHISNCTTLAYQVCRSRTVHESTQHPSKKYLVGSEYNNQRGNSSVSFDRYTNNMGWRDVRSPLWDCCATCYQ